MAHTILYSINSYSPVCESFGNESAASTSVWLLDGNVYHTIAHTNDDDNADAEGDLTSHTTSTRGLGRLRVTCGWWQSSGHAYCNGGVIGEHQLRNVCMVEGVFLGAIVVWIFFRCR